MNVQRDINPENDAKLNKMLDEKFGKRSKTIVEGSAARLIKKRLRKTAKKQFEDTVFNKPQRQKITKKPLSIDEARERHQRLRGEAKKHAQHDQSSHDPTQGRGGGAKAPKTTLSMSSPESADKIKQQLKTDLNKPYVNAYVSTLGGRERPSVMLTVSLDPKESWENGILENSRYGKFDIGHDGRVEQISGHGFPKLRSTKVKSAEHLLSLLNTKLKEDDKKVAKRVVVTKHGKHDQRTHSPTGRASIARERAAGKKPSGAKPSGSQNMSARLRMSDKDLIASYGKGKNKPMTPNNPDGYVVGAAGTKRHPGKAERAVLMHGLTRLGSRTRWAAAVRRGIKRKLRQRKTVKGMVDKHGQHDQSSHDPTQGRGGRGGVEREPVKPELLPAKITTRDRIRNALSDIDRVIGGVKAGTRLYRELKSVKESLQEKLRRKKKKAVSTGDISKVEATISDALEKGISHSLEILTNAIRLIGEQEPDKQISEADEKKLQEIIDEILGVAGYLDTAKEEGQFEKGEAAVPDSRAVDRPSFTTPAVAREQKRQGIKPNAKGRGTSTAREPGY